MVLGIFNCLLYCCVIEVFVVSFFEGFEDLDQFGMILFRADEDLKAMVDVLLDLIQDLRNASVLVQFVDVIRSLGSDVFLEQSPDGIPISICLDSRRNSVGQRSFISQVTKTGNYYFQRWDLAFQNRCYSLRLEVELSWEFVSGQCQHTFDSLLGLVSFVIQLCLVDVQDLIDEFVVV
ncbi:hypothetical protein WICPIJ_007700 [Wickerhamomyces pijperi]|uniref:Uncharacterized protein n=1 Tax=Wickerhamomyces pijperi TaxID=599730 RepID=A0A9P8PZA6_WICPI|nr:hypothetical protein WICPIJ_007700 [Wickerhamomyces pijperi]